MAAGGPVLDRVKLIVYRFGVFELNPATRELRKHGVRIRLSGQPMEVLLHLLESGDRCVTREELQQVLWPGQVWADLDGRLNKVVNRIREPLGDSGDHPRYIETLPRTGYRFLLPVKIDELPCSPPDTRQSPKQPGATSGSYRRKISPLQTQALILLCAAALVVVALFASIVKNRLRSGPLLDPYPLTAFVGVEESASISPRGDSVAFSWNGGLRNDFDIYSIRLANRKLVRLTHEPGRDFGPAWSPDERSIAYLHESGAKSAALVVIPAGGGAARNLGLITWGRTRPTLDWSRDCHWIVTSHSEGELHSTVLLISTITGERHELTIPPAESKGDFYPVFSPDGQKIAFVRFVTGYWSDVFTVEFDSSRAVVSNLRRVSKAGLQIGALTWLTNDELALSARPSIEDYSLYRMKLNSGKALNVATVRIAGIEPTYASSTGTLVYTASAAQQSIWTLPLDNSGLPLAHAEPTRIIASSGIDAQADFSPTGAGIVFASDRLRQKGIWKSAGDGSEAQVLVNFGEGGASAPRWSPDGATIIFESRRGGASQIFIHDLATGANRVLAGGDYENFLPAWSHDGKMVYFCSTRSGSAELWKMPSRGGRAERVTVRGGIFAAESPDGQYLFYTTALGSSILCRRSLVTGVETDVARDVETVPGFAVSKAGVYYIAPGNEIRYVDSATGRNRPVYTSSKSFGNGFALSADGRRLLFTVTEREDSHLMITRNFQ